MADYTKDILRIVKKNKCAFVRHGKGDHDTWYSPISNRNFTIDNAVKDRHLANLVMKQAGINHKF
jgi:hypothetical protein